MIGTLQPNKKLNPKIICLFGLRDHRRKKKQERSVKLYVFIFRGRGTDGLVRVYEKWIDPAADFDPDFDHDQ